MRDADHALTPAEREAIQDWMARRYLQLNVKRVGQREGDKPFPLSVVTATQQKWYCRRIYGRRILP